MCCPGCQAVATAIVDGGLSNFYRFRTEQSNRPEDQQLSYQAYDLPQVQADFVTALEPGCLRAELLLEGITCAACSWLIDQHLKSLSSENTGLKAWQLNASNQRLQVDLNPDDLLLSDVMASLASIGYKPMPATDSERRNLLKREGRTALMRLGVAGFAMMHVMMMAVALYAGAMTDSDPTWKQFFRWVSLIVTTPVVLFSARPFFIAAKKGIAQRALNMDLPVSLAIGGAYSASIWATVQGTGEVYFDSVVMFTFFLLVGRYLEMRARHSNRLATDFAAALMPLTANQRQGDSWQQVPVKTLSVSDRVLVKAGETLPCDGVVVSGVSSVVEAIVTGEAEPVAKTLGAKVIAGSVNTDSELEIEVTAVGGDTQLSAIERLVRGAAEDKPRQQALADKLSRYFVAIVLVVSLSVFTSWVLIEPAHALWVTISVLVVTCPCALALATPAALTAATSWLRRHGLLITRAFVLERLGQVTTVVLDKTGTLTKGKPSLVESVAWCSQSNSHLEQLAAALQSNSNHPIAAAFVHIDASGVAIDNARQITGQGIEAELGARTLRLGRLDFVVREGIQCPSDNRLAQASLHLADDSQLLASFILSDQPRESAVSALAEFSRLGVSVELLSGDTLVSVEQLAEQLNIGKFQSQCTPEDKLARVKALQAQGEVVLMLGDGINDVPVLAGADISVAMGQAADLAKTRADSVLLSQNLALVPEAMAKSKATVAVIRQNFAWALGYNLLALPLAVMGMIPPWAAAIGMSASSLVVIANSLRLNKR